MKLHMTGVKITSTFFLFLLRNYVVGILCLLRELFILYCTDVCVWVIWVPVLYIFAVEKCPSTVFVALCWVNKHRQPMSTPKTVVTITVNVQNRFHSDGKLINTNTPTSLSTQQTSPITTDQDTANIDTSAAPPVTGKNIYYRDVSRKILIILRP